MAPHLFTEAMGLASIAEARRAYETSDLRATLSGQTEVHLFHNHEELARAVRTVLKGWYRTVKLAATLAAGS